MPIATLVRDTGAGTMCRMAYRSRSLLPQGPERLCALMAILGVARARNAALDVTGVLYCGPDSFLQVLEGPSAALLAVFDSITLDSRHADVTVLGVQARVERRFAGWSMALVDQWDFRGILGDKTRLPSPVAFRLDEFCASMHAVLARTGR